MNFAVCELYLKKTVIEMHLDDGSVMEDKMSRKIFCYLFGLAKESDVLIINSIILPHHILIWLFVGIILHIKQRKDAIEAIVKKIILQHS